MAFITSLGVHKPSALPFLIEEGILPSDPSEALYTWQTLQCDDCEDGVQEEELLTTKYCVVWSRASIVERVFRFNVEEESITQALFTYFSARTSGDASAYDAVSDSPRSNGDPSLRVKRSRPASNISNKQTVAPVLESLPHQQSQRFNPAVRGERALVVVLKTQAHVFLLSKTSFVVHLPFEVDTVFPSTYGLLLQRRISEKDQVQPTPQLPPPPENTFAFSQSSTSTQAPGPYGVRDVRNDTTQDSTPLFTNLLKKIQKQPKQESEQKISRLFCLTDPLAEIGTVVIRKPARNDGSKYPLEQNPEFSGLDPSERLLYISPKDEISRNIAPLPSEGPLMIAVTQNQISGTISVSKVTYLDRESSSSSHHSQHPSAASTFSRRRSSFAPGLGTGSSTPLARSHRHTSKDPALEDEVAPVQEELLDHAFEDPAISAKASRRQSSLLARADLSASTTFTDLLGGSTGLRNSRRGASFGVHNTRRSGAGLDTGNSFTKPQPLNQIRASLGTVSLDDSGVDDLMTELDDPIGVGDVEDQGFHNDRKGLNKGVIFDKLYSMPCESHHHHSHSNHPPPTYPKVFTFEPPKTSLGDACPDAKVGLCLIDRIAHEVLFLYIHFTSNIEAHGPLANRIPGLKTRVTGIRRTNVIDACKVSDGTCCRILILYGEAGSLGKLSLEAPWSSSRKIELPSPLSLHDPFQITNEVYTQRRGEGSFKRIIRRNPRALTAVQAGTRQGRVDVVDSDGIRHRIQIRLVPRDSLVARVISVAQAVLPATEFDGETILRGWWDAMTWLRSRPEQDDNLEWTAILVVLLSMGVAFTEDRRTETPSRQKKRKGGLLRSSSGANTDLESWEAMLLHEASPAATLPVWMQRDAWEWTMREVSLPQTSVSRRSRPSNAHAKSETLAVPIPKKSVRLLHCVSLARDFLRSPTGQAASGKDGFLPTASARDSDFRRTALASILVALHLLREELKLDILAADALHQLTPLLAQLGGWLGWQTWAFGDQSYYMQESIDMESHIFDDATMIGLQFPAEPFPPPSILHFAEKISMKINLKPFTSLLDVASSAEGMKGGSKALAAKMLQDLTPRTVIINGLLASYESQSTEDLVAQMAALGTNVSFLETVPESVAITFRTALSACQANPSTMWNHEILQLIGRDDIAMLELEDQGLRPDGRLSTTPGSHATRDVHSICSTALDAEVVGLNDGSPFVDRQFITRLLFKDDQRFNEATKLVHPLLYPVARCTPEPEWTDTDLLEAQQELAKVIAMRTLSVSPGRGLLFYNARMPLLTEKFPVHGFSLSCVMKPTDTTVTADRTIFTEEKVSWAFFHAGVEAGLSISKDASGVDTSWILFNKPRELNNRHAGFLLALGLNGHLKSIAKWVAFKYLTPKHTMTSIGLLLGLSASYMGSMDSLITRLLSVHVTRMLPPGAAELNLSPLTQTSGIMGIGLLYCTTQHRRMSEIMLSEMENADEDSDSNPLETLRDEGYRLAAGFALGFINLGQGKDLKGLHDMHITQRLLTLAITTKDVGDVHILDKATPGATVALALIFMKTGNEALARKVDIPDTTHQFEYVRPDVFLLRTVARHLIMWNQIKASKAWLQSQLPLVFQDRRPLSTVRTLTSEDMPFFNVVAGLCLSFGLRYAGSASFEVRDLLCSYLDEFMRICRLSTLSYDGKLARTSIRNCQDVVALAASCVMAGTGDLHIFRRLRALHGRIDAHTPYGSHLAAHFAIGVLFLGGGTHTFGTSNMAVASLLCAFYPLFPNAVLDNKSHLQAFRHFWVLATERRCLIVRDVDTSRPVSLNVIVTFRSGVERALTAPCLLPELDSVAKVRTNDPDFWTVTLDLASNPRHLKAFMRHQSIYVRRRAAYDAHTSVFSATMQALNDAQSASLLSRQSFQWIFTLPAFAGLDRTAQALVLPAETSNAIYQGTRGTVVDDRLVLEKACLNSGRSERLWNLRLLFAWAEQLEGRPDGGMWLAREVVDGLKAALITRRRAALRR